MTFAQYLNLMSVIAYYPSSILLTNEVLISDYDIEHLPLCDDIPDQLKALITLEFRMT